MPALRYTTLFSHRALRVQAVLAIAIHLGIVIPVPIPVLPAASTVAQHRSDERYPCEGCKCCCSTAAHCWTKCCCMSAADRVAWAKRNQVKVPESLREAAEPVAPASSRDKPEGDWIVAIQAQRCQGGSDSLRSAATLFWPPATFTVPVDQSVSDSQIVVATLYAPLSMAPPAPPPRVPLLCS